jgi:hypothetical protein
MNDALDTIVLETITDKERFERFFTMFMNHKVKGLTKLSATIGATKPCEYINMDGKVYEVCLCNQTIRVFDYFDFKKAVRDGLIPDYITHEH